MRRTLACLALFLMPIVTTGAQSFTDRHSEKYPVDPHTDLVLRNVVGDISIVGWDEAQVQVDWALAGYTKRSLDTAWVEINPGNNLLEIRTAYPVAKDAAIRARQVSTGPDSVNYIVHVPRNLHSIEVTTKDGDVRVTGVASDLDVSTRNGTVSIDNVAGNLTVTTMHASQAIRLGRIVGDRSIRLQSINGAIRLSLARNSDTTLQVISANGGLSNEFGWVPQRKQLERDLQAKLGNGHAQVNIEEVNGSVNLIAESQ